MSPRAVVRAVRFGPCPALPFNLVALPLLISFHRPAAPFQPPFDHSFDVISPFVRTLEIVAHSRKNATAPRLSILSGESGSGESTKRKSGTEKIGSLLSGDYLTSELVICEEQTLIRWLDK